MDFVSIFDAEADVAELTKSGVECFNVEITNALSAMSEFDNENDMDATYAPIASRLERISKTNDD